MSQCTARTKERRTRCKRPAMPGKPVCSSHDPDRNWGARMCPRLTELVAAARQLSDAVDAEGTPAPTSARVRKALEPYDAAF